MCKHKEIIVKVPMHIKPFRYNKEDVCIDEGMIDTINKLWENHVITLSSCQGYEYMDHPYNKKNIIIHERYDEDDIDFIKSLIDKDIIILQWKENLEEV